MQRPCRLPARRPFGADERNIKKKISECYLTLLKPIQPEATSKGKQAIKHETFLQIFAVWVLRVKTPTGLSSSEELQ